MRGATIDAPRAPADPANDGDGDDAVVFAHLYDDLRRFAAVTGPVDLDPDDLVQEAVVRTIRIHRLSDLDDPGAYLRRTIVNLAHNRRRSLSRARRAFARLDGHERVDEHPSDLGDLERVGPVARAVLFLVEVEGWTFAEAAQQLGMTEEAARTRASRARRQLRAALEEDDHDR